MNIHNKHVQATSGVVLDFDNATTKNIEMLPYTGEGIILNMIPNSTIE